MKFLIFFLPIIIFAQYYVYNNQKIELTLLKNNRANSDIKYYKKNGSIVGIKNGIIVVTDDDIDNILKDYKITIKRVISDTTYLLKVGKNMDYFKTLHQLEKDDRIDQVQPNFYMKKRHR